MSRANHWKQSIQKQFTASASRYKIASGLLALLAIIGFQSALHPQPNLGDPNLSPEERRRILRHQENLWSVRESDQPLTYAQALQELLLPTRINVDPRTAPVVRAANLQLFIPADAFPGHQQIAVEIVSLTRHADFFFAGVPMHNDSAAGQIIFESSGMFKLSFKDARGKSIQPRSALRVSLQSIQPGLESNVYRFDARKWQLKEERIAATNPVNSNNTTNPENLEVNPECADGECGEGNYMPQVYGKIDYSGWWNFDKPHKEYTCVSSRVISAPANTQIQAIGVDYFGISYAKPRPGGSFAINAVKNKKVKLIAIRYPTRKGEPVWIGYLPTAGTPGNTAFVQGNRSTGCKTLGPIKMRQYPASILKDRTAFLKTIEMPDV